MSDSSKKQAKRKNASLTSNAPASTFEFFEFEEEDDYPTTQSALSSSKKAKPSKVPKAPKELTNPAEYYELSKALFGELGKDVKALYVFSSPQALAAFIHLLKVIVSSGFKSVYFCANSEQITICKQLETKSLVYVTIPFPTANPTPDQKKAQENCWFSQVYWKDDENNDDLEIDIDSPVFYRALKTTSDKEIVALGFVHHTKYDTVLRVFKSNGVDINRTDINGRVINENEGPFELQAPKTVAFKYPIAKITKILGELASTNAKTVAIKFDIKDDIVKSVRYESFAISNIQKLGTETGRDCPVELRKGSRIVSGKQEDYWYYIPIDASTMEHSQKLQLAAQAGKKIAQDIKKKTDNYDTTVEPQKYSKVYFIKFLLEYLKISGLSSEVFFEFKNLESSEKSEDEAQHPVEEDSKVPMDDFNILNVHADIPGGVHLQFFIVPCNYEGEDQAQQ